METSEHRAQSKQCLLSELDCVSLFRKSKSATKTLETWVWFFSPFLYSLSCFFFVGAVVKVSPLILLQSSGKPVLIKTVAVLPEHTRCGSDTHPRCGLDCLSGLGFVIAATFPGMCCSYAVGS